MSIPGYNVETLLLEPGDVAFTHSNLLHCSRPNLSDRWRRNFIVAYNSKENQPLERAVAGQPTYSKVGLVADSALQEKGCVPLDPARPDFLDQGTTKKQIDDNEDLKP